MSVLYEQFVQEATAENPPGMSVQLRFLFWVADKRGQSKAGPVQNPPADHSGYWDLDQITQAGEAMGLDGYDLQAFTDNAATWF